MYPIANGSFSDHIAELSYCSLKEKPKYPPGFSLLQTQVEKKVPQHHLRSHYFDHFCLFLASSTVTRTILGRYMSGRATSPPQANKQTNHRAFKQHKYISLSFLPPSRNFRVILSCDSSLSFYILS